MLQKSLVIKTHPSNVEVDYSASDIITVKIHSDMDLHIEFDNNVMLETKGDFTIASQGELSLISLGEPLCLDSVDSVIHMNYRQSKHLIDLPESIEYRKSLDKETQIRIDTSKEGEDEYNHLKKRILILEKLVEDISNKLINDYERKKQCQE